MSKWTTLCSWEHSPHITKTMIESMLSSIPPHQRSARSQGIPQLGSGLIYPIEESAVTILDFELPDFYPRAYALDTGWNRNAVTWMAYNPNTDTIYIYDCYKRGQAEPPSVAASITSRGAWIPGIADAADISRLDGRQYIEIYRNLGLDLELPNKAFETGITQTWVRLTTGRLKIFQSCSDVFEELRTYARNVKGDIPDDPRHDIMDTLRYLVMGGISRAKLPPRKKDRKFSDVAGALSWMG